MATGLTRHVAFRYARRYVAGLNEDAALRRRPSPASRRSPTPPSTSSAKTSTTRRRPTPSSSAASSLAARLAAPSGNLPLARLLASRPCRRCTRACSIRVRQIAAGLPPGMRLRLGAQQSAPCRCHPAGSRSTRPPTGGDAVMQGRCRRTCAGAPATSRRLAAANIPRAPRQGHLRRAARARLPVGRQETDGAFVALAHRLARARGRSTPSPRTTQALLARAPADAGRGSLARPSSTCSGVRADDARRLVADGGSACASTWPTGERWFRYAARRAAESIGA